MKTIQITRTAILTALVAITMALINFTIFQSSLHLGSLLIVVISLSFPKKEALFASSVGPTIFDIVSGWGLYAPFTFIARFALSYIVCLAKEKNLVTQVIAALFGGIIVIGVYFIANMIFLGSLSASLTATIPDVLQLVLTVAGVFIAIPIKNIVKE